MSRNRTSIPSLALLTVLGVVGLAVLAPPALAHSIVKSTEPGGDEVLTEPPTRVLMVFNEPVEVAFGAIRVFDTNGRRVDTGRADHVPARPEEVQVELEPQLPEGTYIVSWRIISADSHPIQEAFLFHVGHPGEQPAGLVSRIVGAQGRSGPFESVLFGAARFVIFAALILLGGAIAFLAAVWRRPGPWLALRPPEVEERFAERWRRLVVWSWVALVVATLAAIVLQGAVGAGVPMAKAFSASIIREVLGTRFGLVSMGRLVLLLAAAALWLGARTIRAVPLAPKGALAERRTLAAAALHPPIPAWFLGGSTVLIVALLATPGLAGHAGTTQPVLLNVATDVLHVIGAAVWMGALIVLLAVAFPATRRLDELDRCRVMAPVVSRFSDLAVLAVAVIVATGVYRSWVEVRALRALTDATYGWVLLTKLGVFLPILALGVVNNRWTKPRCELAARGEGPLSALRILRRLVAVEVALAIAVVGVTALLVNLPPARVEAGVEGPFMTETRIGGHHLAIGIDPNQVGENMVHLSLTDEEGLPGHAEEVRVQFRMPDEGIGPIPAHAEPRGPGVFLVHGHQLSVPGAWELEIVARLDEFTEERATVEVIVNP
jgi:copper transport protein